MQDTDCQTGHHLVWGEISTTATATAPTIPKRRIMSVVSAAATPPPPPPSGPPVSRYICPFRRNLDQPALEEALVERHGVGDEGWLRKLDVRKALRVARPFVAKDGNSVDRATRLKVSLKLLGCRTVINVANINGTRVDGFFVFTIQIHLLLDCRLHLAQLCGLFLHFLHLPLEHLEIGVSPKSFVILLVQVFGLLGKEWFVIRHG